MPHVILDTEKKVSAATTAYLEVHSDKEDQDLRVGTLLTLEGGVAYNVPKIGGAFGIGPDVRMAVFQKGASSVW